MYGAEITKLRKIDHIYFKRCEILCWQRMQNITSIDRVKIKEVLYRVKKETDILRMQQS
jgi:hypothetical protein